MCVCPLLIHICTCANMHIHSFKQLHSCICTLTHPHNINGKSGSLTGTAIIAGLEIGFSETWDEPSGSESYVRMWVARAWWCPLATLFLRNRGASLSRVAFLPGPGICARWFGWCRWEQRNTVTSVHGFSILHHCHLHLYVEHVPFMT